MELKCEDCGEMTDYVYIHNGLEICDDCLIALTLNVKHPGRPTRLYHNNLCECCKQDIHTQDHAIRCNGGNCKHGIEFICDTCAEWSIKDNTWVCALCAKDIEVVDSNEQNGFVMQ